MKTETDVQTLTILAVEREGGAALRNNSGCLPNPETGIPVRFGLGNTSARLNEVFKTGDLVGLYQGVFCMWECKKPGWVWRATARERAQWAAILWTRQHGGRAGFTTSPEMSVAIMKGWAGGAYGA